jgi:hypothetical protein
MKILEKDNVFYVKATIGQGLTADLVVDTGFSGPVVLGGKQLWPAGCSVQRCQRMSSIHGLIYMGPVSSAVATVGSDSYHTFHTYQGRLAIGQCAIDTTFVVAPDYDRHILTLDALYNIIGKSGFCMDLFAKQIVPIRLPPHRLSRCPSRKRGGVWMLPVRIGLNQGWFVVDTGFAGSFLTTTKFLKHTAQIEETETKMTVRAWQSQDLEGRVCRSVCSLGTCPNHDAEWIAVDSDMPVGDGLVGVKALRTVQMFFLSTKICAMANGKTL